MYKQFKDIKTIKFPVFKLPSTDWYKTDGVLFIDDNLVLDDTNMPGKTLGVRRLQCGRTDLYKLRGAHLKFHDMLTSKRKIFIDNKGTPFIYERTVHSPLVFHRVKRIEPKESASIIWLEGVPYPFSLEHPPYGEANWARVLYYKGGPWMIYDYAKTRGKDSFQRV
jgi:hypothetical protein